MQCPDDGHAAMDAMGSVASWVRLRFESSSMLGGHVGAGDAMRQFDECLPPDSSPGCGPMFRASCSS